MKERLINNLGLKILSIFLAFVIWFGVVNVSNPEVNRTKEVSLEIVNGHVLTSARKAYEISGKDTVTVTYDVRTRDAYKVRSSDFRAYVDLAQLYSVTGSVPVQVEVLNNRDILANVSARPGVVHVDTEDLQTKSFDLNMNVTGKAQDGYAPDGISLNPPYVTLEGPVSKVGQVSAAGVEISIDGLAEDQSGVVTPVFYDANGNSLKLSDQVRVNTPEIEYHLTINKVKELPLEFEVSGTVAPGYQYVGAECSRRTVSVIGLKSNLAGLSRITIPAQELTVEGATQDRVVSLDLHRFLPEGIRMAESESSSIEVRHVDDYLAAGREPTLADGLDSILIFKMIQPELDKAKERSARARAAAERRRHVRELQRAEAERAAAAPEAAVESAAPEIDGVAGNDAAAATVVAAVADVSAVEAGMCAVSSGGGGSAGSEFLAVPAVGQRGAEIAFDHGVDILVKEAGQIVGQRQL